MTLPPWLGYPLALGIALAAVALGLLVGAAIRGRWHVGAYLFLRRWWDNSRPRRWLLFLRDLWRGLA